jgi:hypothetical protein
MTGNDLHLATTGPGTIERPTATGTRPLPATDEGGADLLVSRSVDPGELRALLTHLAKEDCVHSWRNFGIDGTVDELLAWENRLRPTEIFFFHLRQGGSVRLAGAGAVADRLNAEFPYPGFAVLSRCFIMPEFRGHGLYRHLLRYRMEYCRRRFGGSLDGIHIGSTEQRVARVLLDHRLDGWPSFSHLGEERLHIAGAGRTVQAYMLLMPRYAVSLLGELADDGAPAAVITLRRRLERADAGEARELALLLRNVLDDTGGAGWFEAHCGPATTRLLAFCRAVPLVEMT